MRPLKTSVLPDHPVRRFAEIMAALADPFAERATVLRAAGHDATSWERIEREWIQRIEQDRTGDLGLAFGQAFAQAKTGPNEDALDRTAELRALRPGPVLPFSAACPGEESGVRPGPAVRRIYEPPIRPAMDTSERTLEISRLGPHTPALPFAPPSPSCRRLHRFDTQTGLPLPSPYWSDDAKGSTDPTKSA